jgi:hypothetical protein
VTERTRIADDYSAIREGMRKLRPEPEQPIMTATEVEARTVDYSRRWIVPWSFEAGDNLSGFQEFMRKYYEAVAEKMYLQPDHIAKRVFSTAPGTVNSAPKDTITMQSVLDACAEAKRIAIVYESPLRTAARTWGFANPLKREQALLSYVEDGDDGE